MTRGTIPWLLAALMAGLWVGTLVGGAGDPVEPSQPETSPPEDTTKELQQLRTEVAELRAIVLARGAAQLESPGRTVGDRKQNGAARSARPRSKAFQAREAAAREQRERRAAAQASAQHRKIWHDALQSTSNDGTRERTVDEMRAALEGDDAARSLAALSLLRWHKSLRIPTEGMRVLIEPHTDASDVPTREAALIALAHVDPLPEDAKKLAMLASEDTLRWGEGVAEAVVLTSEGVIDGAAAQAVLGLLAEDGPTKKAFVMRGLQNAKEWAPAVEARLLEIVRKAPPRDYDGHYFFHFLTSRMDPKSDAVLDVMLERIERAPSDADTVARGLRVGLSEQQRTRATERLLEMARAATKRHALRGVLVALGQVATKRDLETIRGLQFDPGDELLAQAHAELLRVVEAR